MPFVALILFFSGERWKPFFFFLLVNFPRRRVKFCDRKLKQKNTVKISPLIARWCLSKTRPLVFPAPFSAGLRSACITMGDESSQNDHCCYFLLTEIRVLYTQRDLNLVCFLPCEGKRTEANETNQADADLRNSECVCLVGLQMGLLAFESNILQIQKFSQKREREECPSESRSWDNSLPSCTVEAQSSVLVSLALILSWSCPNYKWIG